MNLMITMHGEDTNKYVSWKNNNQGRKQRQVGREGRRGQKEIEPIGFKDELHDQCMET